MVLTMTAGTGLIMWLGELITERGIGNGMSLLIFTSIAAGFPASLWASRQQEGPLGRLHRRHPARRPRHGARSSSSSSPSAGSRCSTPSAWSAGGCTAGLDLHPAQGQHGRRHPGHLRVVAALSCPAWSPSSTTRQPGRQQPRAGSLDQTTPGPGDTRSTWLIYFLAHLFFTFFYVSITFNPSRGGRQHEEYGGFIPGIRAGKPTAEYLDYVLTRITVPGSLYLGLDLAHPADRLR
jgi:preprotein translocase subunit SecY